MKVTPRQNKTGPGNRKKPPSTKKQKKRLLIRVFKKKKERGALTEDVDSVRKGFVKTRKGRRNFSKTGE